MSVDFKKRLIEYMQLYGVSRHEQEVASAIKHNLKDTKSYEFSYDNFGSLIMHKKSKNKNAPKVMIAAHMDEVGFLVRNIHEKGQILLEPVGGIWPTVVIGTKAILKLNNNQLINGVFGHTSIHIMEAEKRSKAITSKELYADFGFKNKQEALDFGVEIGNLVYMTGETIEFANPDLIGGKAMDNRAGVTVLDFIAREIDALELDIDLYLVATVQEEVGTRGAKTATSIINPEVAIALDTTSTHDTIGTIDGTTALFKGAALRVADGGALMDVKLINFFSNLSKKHNINAYKFISMGGGTDAASMQYAQAGAAALTISLPQRYLHSPIGVCAISDLVAAKDLLVKFVSEFDSKEYDKIKYK